MKEEKNMDVEASQRDTIMIKENDKLVVRIPWGQVEDILRKVFEDNFFLMSEHIELECVYDSTDIKPILAIDIIIEKPCFKN